MHISSGDEVTSVTRQVFLLMGHGALDLPEMRRLWREVPLHMLKRRLWFSISVGQDCNFHAQRRLSESRVCEAIHMSFSATGGSVLTTSVPGSASRMTMSCHQEFGSWSLSHTTSSVDEAAAIVSPTRQLMCKRRCTSDWPVHGPLWHWFPVQR